MSERPRERARWRLDAARLAVALLWLLVAGAQPRASSPLPPEFHLIVQLRAATAGPATARAAMSSAQRLTEERTVATLAGRQQLLLRHERAITTGLHALTVQALSNSDTLAAMLARLRKDPAVATAEADQRRHPSALTPDDPLFVSSSNSPNGQWFLQAPSGSAVSAIDAVDAWPISPGSFGLVIADIDTGVRFEHPDLLRAAQGGRLLPGYSFISDPLAANEGGATWVADASDPGDWLTQADTASADFTGCPVTTSSWHGLRVAGLLGALTNNNVGVAGVTWDGWILPVRALGKCGGMDSDIQTAMLWAAGVQVYDDNQQPVPLNPYPANIINMSLGGVGTCPSAYGPVIDQLTQLGVLVVVAAGNEGGPVDAPGNCAGVLTVAGLRQVGTKVGYSNLGPEVSVAAPAGNCVNGTGACLYSIDTTVNSGATTPAANVYTDAYNYNTGTSFSTPQVAGTAALMLAINGNLSPASLIQRIKQAASGFPQSAATTCHVPVDSSDLQTSECNCTTTTCGAGMLQAANAAILALRPAVMITVPATFSAGQPITLSAGAWAACPHPGAVAHYQWSARDSNSTITAGASSSTVTVTPPSGTSSSVLQLIATDIVGNADTETVTLTATTATTSAPVIAALAGLSSSVIAARACPAAILPAPPTLPVTVDVAPAGVTVQGDMQQQFAATVLNSASNAVSWSVNGIVGGGAGIGTISTTGLYTAPNTIPSGAVVTVTAASVSAPTASGFAGVTITPSVTVAIAPMAITLDVAGGSTQFTATVGNSTNTAVTWEVNGIVGGNASIGTVSNLGFYAAPATVPAGGATLSVTAVSQADGMQSATASVTLAPVAVTIAPTSGSVQTGATLAFTASVQNAPQSSVSWQVNGIAGGNATLGTLSPSGVYTAPAAVPSPATVTVSAVASADPTKSATAAVTIVGSSGSASSSSSSSSSSTSSTSSTSSSGSSGTSNSGGSSGGNSGSGSHGGGALRWPSLLMLGAMALGAQRRRW